MVLILRRKPPETVVNAMVLFEDVSIVITSYSQLNQRMPLLILMYTALLMVPPIPKFKQLIQQQVLLIIPLLLPIQPINLSRLTLMTNSKL